MERFGVLHRIAAELRDTAGIAQVAPRDRTASFACRSARRSDDALAIGGAYRRELLDEWAKLVRDVIVHHRLQLNHREHMIPRDRSYP